MFIHFNFTTGILHRGAFELLWYVLNNPSITSVANMTSRGDWTNSTFSLASNVVTNFNAAGSLIVRTVDPTNVQAHRFVDSTGATSTITLQFQSYDLSSLKYYVQSTGTTSSSLNIRSGTAVSPSFDTAPTVSASGSRMSLSNSNDAFLINSSYSYVDIWFYVTNNVILFHGTTGSSTSKFGNTNGIDGPIIIGQYTRYDSFNTASVGVIPAVVNTAYNATNNPYYGLNSVHFNTLRNPHAGQTGLAIINGYNMVPSTTGSYPSLTYNQCVHLGVGSRSAENGQLTTSATSTTSGAAVYGAALSSTSGQLVRNATNTGNGFAFLPLFWTFGGANWAGGNISDKTGIYVINGDFSAADDFSLNGKTYIVWPLNEGTTTSRIALAVPQE